MTRWYTWMNYSGLLESSYLLINPCLNSSGQTICLSSGARGQNAPPSLMVCGLAQVSSTEEAASLPWGIFYHRWHCGGQLDHDHICATDGSMLSADVRHCRPNVCFCWPKMLLHFRRASLDRQTGCQRRACPDGSTTTIGPTTSALAEPKRRVESPMGPCVELTPWWFGALQRWSPDSDFEQSCCLVSGHQMFQTP
jgi:hypothetical protein